LCSTRNFATLVKHITSKKSKAIMKKIHQRLLALSILAMGAGTVQAQQTTLLHYWSFNNVTTAYHNPNIPAFHATYSVLDTTKANVVYTLLPGTSSTYGGYVDNNAGDTMNAQMGAVAGNALRLRNPSDSMELRVYAPTTGYHGDISIKYEVETSSATSGQLAQLFDYSVDSGTTWKTSGLSATLDSVNSFTGSSWGLVSVLNTDTTIRNNPKFIFRIKFSGNTVGSSGNNRFDNMTVSSIVDTTTITPPPVDTTADDSFHLIHYWNFNNIDSAYHNPNIPVMHASYSAIDTNKANVVYTLAPGASSTYAGYIDNVAGDTANAQMGAGAGNALRVRNPSDSMELRVYTPTTGYGGNISIKFIVESSSVASGQLAQLYDYSIDSGATWKTSGLNITIDSVNQPQFQGALWGLISLNFNNDTLVRNNPKLVFRIKFAGNTTGSSGNNRFDNLTVESIPTATDTTTTPPPPTAISNVNNGQSFVLYPNPTTGTIHINAITASDVNKVIALYNAYGQRVYTATSKENNVTVNVQNLPAGVYYVAVTQGSRTSIKTFVKK
jgi:hypothetical protein